MKKYLRYILLFLAAVLTTTIAGAEHITGKLFFGFGVVPPEHLLDYADLTKGLPYSFAFLAFLTVHEFGHYFTAIYYRVKTSLPFYIPMYIPGMLVNIGSLGAVIRLKSIPESTRKFFDIGIAGPLAGFVVSILLLIYGFATLPPMEEYVLSIHPEYLEMEEFCGVPTEAQMDAYLQADTDRISLKVGSSLLFEFLAYVIPSDPSQVPSPYEIIHYPFLFVGFITLFFTALNLLPIGQLDGGHVTYGMFGRKQAGYISRAAVIGLLFMGGTGLMDLRNFADIYVGMGFYTMFLVYVCGQILQSRDAKWVLAMAAPIFMMQLLIKWNFPSIEPNLMWLFFALLGVRFVGMDHPPAYMEHRVNRPRQILGWVAIVIFILCFTPNPLLVVG